MSSLEEDLFQYLKAHKKPKIHVSEITKRIPASEEQIKNILLKITSEDPVVGKFNYSTGWFEREISVETPKSLKYKKVCAVSLLVIGAGLMFLPPIFSFYLDGLVIILGFYLGGFLIILGLLYLIKLYYYDSQGRALATAFVVSRTLWRGK
ncbi:MAG: hypothetical protein ACFFCZ_04555 [Promethearchaeota archaeon]